MIIACKTLKCTVGNETPIGSFHENSGSVRLGGSQAQHPVLSHEADPVVASLAEQQRPPCSAHVGGSGLTLPLVLEGVH